MDRQHLAYLLIGLMVATLAALVALQMYYSRDRRIARQRSGERALRGELRNRTKPDFDLTPASGAPASRRGRKGMQT